jgi:CTP synthase
MQMAVVEAAQNLIGLKGAGSTEFGPCADPVVGLMTEWTQGGEVVARSEDSDLGGTMRLGAYDCVLNANSRVRQIYNIDRLSERHRHRYEVNLAYEDRLAKAGMVFSGKSPDGRLPEIMEIPDHPWYVGVQFHPELKSKPFNPHPLFTSFIEAAIAQSRLV